MAKIGWKTVSGRGPYGSLQRTRRKGPKKGSTEHIRYLGKLGEDGLVPGRIIGQGRDAALAPRVDPDLAAHLKPKRRKQLKAKGYIQDEPAGVKELGRASGPHHRHGPAPAYALIPLNNPPVPGDVAKAVDQPTVSPVETALLDQAAQDGVKAVTQVTEDLTGNLKALGASEEHIKAVHAKSAKAAKKAATQAKKKAATAKKKAAAEKQKEAAAKKALAAKPKPPKAKAPPPAFTFPQKSLTANPTPLAKAKFKPLWEAAQGGVPALINAVTDAKAAAGVASEKAVSATVSPWAAEKEGKAIDAAFTYLKLLIENTATGKTDLAKTISQYKSITPEISGEATGTLSKLPETVAAVAGKKLKLPKQKAPAQAVVAQQQTAEVTSLKDYAADLEKISGQKGSQTGGLFKDKKLGTYHYLKWTSTNRARNEALATALYAAAGVLVPNVTTVMHGKDLITKSDWLDGAKPMTPGAMAQSPQVRRHFVLDAWLANWDVAGRDWDNIVDVNGIAYRVDMGGAMLFGGMGKGKLFGPTVPELQTLRDPKINPSASAAFAQVTNADLEAGMKALAGVSAAQIDKLVSASGLPDGPIPERPNIPNIRKYVADTLKQRRLAIVSEISEQLKQGKKTDQLLQDEPAIPAAVAKELKPAVLDWLLKTPIHDLTDPSKRVANLQKLFELQAGKTGAIPRAYLDTTYKGWKNNSSDGHANFFRWVLGAARNRGPEAETAILQAIKELHPGLFEKFKAEIASAKVTKGKDTVKGAKVSRLANNVVFGRVNKSGKTTLWRTWHSDQIKLFGWTGAKAGDTLAWDKPLGFSWSASPHGWNAGAGQIRTTVQISNDDILVSDRFNNTTGSYGSEDEVVWVPRKGKKYKFTVI